MTEKQVSERLASIEASLKHIVKAVDDAARTRETTIERLTRAESRLEHIEKQMPEIRKNAEHNAERDGWFDAKEDAQVDGRARFAIGISLLALLTSTANAISSWFN